MIIIASDKFKGSLTSDAVGEALRAGIMARWPGADVMIYPMADGGDGFEDVMAHYFTLQEIEVDTTDALFRPVKASWRWDRENNTAYISVAAASGLAQLGQNERNPEQTSSFGTGLLIKDACEKAVKTVVLGLGGSATNDAGTGILSALGFSLLDNNREKVEPIGANLSAIQYIIPPEKLTDVVFNIALDVQNPLFGPDGAACIYAPQKGADPAMVQRLDKGLESVCGVLSAAAGYDLSTIAGLGAAGGVAAGLLPFFKLTISPGIDQVISASGLANTIKKASLIITGEGKLDNQSLQGKVVGRIAALAAAHDVKCVAVCGISELSEEEARRAGLQKVKAIRNLAKDERDSITNARAFIEQVAAELIVGAPGFNGN